MPPPIDPAEVVWDERPPIDPSKVVWDEEKPVAAEKPKRGFLGDVGHQLGLAGRAVVEGNPLVALGDVAAAPIRVLGNKIRPGTFTQTGGSALADLLRLPKPEDKNEAIVQALSQAVAGSAGAPALAKIAPNATGLTRDALAWLSDKPLLQMDSALGATAAQLAAQESGVGEKGQFAAALAGGMAGPMASRGTKMLAEPVMDIGATIGANFGHKGSIKRIMTDAVERGVGNEKARVVSALNQATEYVPGAKPTVAEAIAEANLKNPDQFGGWLVRLQKDLTGAKGVEDVLPTVGKEQAGAVAAEGKAVNRELWPVGQEKLASSNAFGGVNPRNVFSALDDMAAKASTQGSTLVKRVLASTRRKISGLVRDDGSIDAEALYSVRKELGNDIKTYQRATNNWDKTVSIGLEREVQKAIDDAIESSGGMGWKSDYMRPYSERMGQLGKQEARNKEVKRIGAQVKPTGGVNVATTETPKPPTLLNRTMMFANFGLRALAQNANDPVVKELTKRMTDPKAFAELLARPDKDPFKMRAMEVIRRGQIAAALNSQNGE